MKAPAPRYTQLAEGSWDSILGDGVTPRAGVEVAFDVHRDKLLATIDRLRTEFEYQQLMEIAGVDYPEREERFEVVYCLLSLTRNHRIRVHVSTDEVKPVPSVTHIWPVAGWLEREVYDMYGVLFEGNTDLRRILTDYGFQGHPQRKDFPLTGYVELRYSEEAKRVVYEPVSLAQDFRNFDFMSPWEGAKYVLPGDEKAGAPPAPPPGDKKETSPGPQAVQPKTSESTAQTGAGEPGPGDKPKRSRAKKADVAPGKGQNQ